MKTINPRFIQAALASLLLFCTRQLPAQVDTPVPHFIAHTGGLSGADATFTGTGNFKFALVAGTGTATAYWNNNNNAIINAPQTPPTEPTASIPLPVTAGGYELFLGTGSTQFIPYSVFSRPNVRVRTWFSRTGAAGSFILQPDTPIPAAAYAMQIPDGTVTTPKIAANAVTSTQIANGAVGLGKLGTNAVTSSNIAPNSIAVGNLQVAAAPANGQVLGFNGTSLNWTTPGSGSGVWALNGPSAFYNGGRVGIGTDSPHTSLQVTNGSFSVTGTNTGISVIGAGKGVFISNSATEGFIFASDFGNFPATPIPLILQNSSGNVGIGVVPTHRLAIAGGPSWTDNGWLGSVELANGAAIGWPANNGGQGFGIGHTNGGFCVFRTASNLGVQNGPAVYDLFVDDVGHVGLGTTTPKTTLDVRGDISGNRLVLRSDPDFAANAAVLCYDPAVTTFVPFSKALGRALSLVVDAASVRTLEIRGGADLAEPFEMKEEELAKGSVVVIDNEHPGRLKRSSRAYDTRVAGIISGANGVNPGIALHQEGVVEGSQNVALTGRVYVQADASSAPIEPGDLLTTSPIPGHAMKVTDHARAQGAVIGKAMSSLDEGTGMVLVLVSLQ